MKQGLDVQSYIDWANSTNSQILYVHGTSYHASHGMADYAWHARTYELRSKSLSFTFDSRDPLRDSISGMVTSVLAQAFAGRVTELMDSVKAIFQDQFVMRQYSNLV